jgi:hypothetical protein
MKKAFSRILLPLSFVLFSILFFSNTLFAQDSIVLINNDVILAKVEEIDVNDIKYHKADNINGPVYDLPKSNIYMIIYMNGTRDVMNQPTQSNTAQQNTPVTNTAAAQFDATPVQNNQVQQSNQSQQNNSGQQYQDNTAYQQNQQNNAGQPDNTLGPNTQYKVPQQIEGPVTIQTFYDELSPYGSWINSQSYGYVWVPNVGPDFAPYSSAGHWAFTEYGWTWVSDFPWGWAPFHYGRWFYEPYLGYVWVPDTHWGPAWVSWRISDGYYGWVAMGPAGYEFPRERWTFVGAGYITDYRIYEHYEHRENVAYIYNNTTVIENNYVDRHGEKYIAGPDRREVERVTHTTVTPLRIAQANNPGQTVHENGELQMYHPAIHEENKVAPARPAQITVTEKITPLEQRTTVVHPVVNTFHGAPAQQQQVNYNHTTPQQHTTNPEPHFNSNASEQHTQPEQHPAPAAQQQNNNNEHPAQQQQVKPNQQQPRPAQAKPAKPATPKPSQPAEKKK